VSSATSKAKLARMKRVTDLFVEGTEVVLDDSETDPVLVWVTKMNPFESEEARKDGSVGKARVLLRLNEVGSPESLLFDNAVLERSHEDLVNAMAAAKFNEDYIRAADDIKADEEWADRLALLERGDEQLRDSGVAMDDDEVTRLHTLNREYQDRLDEIIKEAQEVRKEKLRTETPDELREQFRASYLETSGQNGFINEYRTTELYYVLRDCSAVPNDRLGWDHTGCTHQRLCDSRAEVRELPETLILKVRDAIQQLAMTPRDAGNSDAPASSSASSEQPSKVADSTPSTPDGTSPEPAGT
jgi:hypothetical protein